MYMIAKTECTDMMSTKLRQHYPVAHCQMLVHANFDRAAPQRRSDMMTETRIKGCIDCCYSEKSAQVAIMIEIASAQ